MRVLNLTLTLSLIEKTHNIKNKLQKHEMENLVVNEATVVPTVVVHDTKLNTRKLATSGA